MSKWGKFSKATKTDGSEVARPTLNLRCVVKKSGVTVIEQLIEYCNENNQVVHSQWCEIPTIYEE